MSQATQTARGDPAGDFYSIEAALADTLKVPCKVLLDIPNAGHLEGTTEKHLRSGTNLELPFWMANTLIAKDIVEHSIPRCFGPRVRNALQASARAVNLRNLGGGGGAFYAGGAMLANPLTGTMVDPPFLAALDRSFRERMLDVIDQSQHTSADGGGEGAAYEFCQSLDTWEKQLFHRGEMDAKEFKNWSEAKAKKSSR